ncbi:unnamed protein product [Ectocarpus sp. 6 AP-2014]
MEAPLERMPSSAESESAFSAATEAESEMTDGGFEDADIRTEYFLSYPTDCLSAYELIKKRSLHGVRALDDLCVMIKGRVGLEESYAKGLDKVANQAFRDGLDAGSFREGLEGLRSDLVNKAVQHRALAKNISSDVLEPLTELRGQLSSKTKALVAKATKLQRDTRAADEKYRRSHTRYHRCHREAALSLSAAVEGGAVPSSEPRRRPSLERSSTTPESTTSNSNSGGGGRRPAAVTLPPSPLAGAGAGAPAPPLRRRAMSATLDKVREAMPSSSNKKDLVQWFLPSEKTRKEALIESAQAAADAAEEARKACLACWVALRSGVHSAVQEFQRVLTDFQGCEEQLVSEAQDGMRKHVVFESSSLANQQYDLQMLFKLMEAVNVEMDLRNFIRSARREVASDSVAAAAAQATAAAAARKEDVVGGAAASAPGSATSSVEAANGAGLGAGGGGGGGAGVLSSRGDRRGAALALQRLFGVGQDLPPPPTEEAWVPPEVEGETPAACRQTLVELFHAPLITKEDISMYLDATDPVAGAAASEAAAAAIKALGAPTLAGGARGAAAMDAKMDAALAKLSSHYPVVTPAASVYEVLGFAAQARHAKNYKDLLAGASDAGIGDGGSGSGERGDAEGRVSQPPIPCPDAGAGGAGGAASEQRGGAADGANAPEGSSSSNVAGPSGGNSENTGDTAVSPPAAPDDSGDSARSSGANAEKAASSSDGVVSNKPSNSSSSREGLDGGVIGGVAAAFADAVAAFTAADSSTPQIDQEPSSEPPAKTAVDETPAAMPAATPVGNARSCNTGQHRSL